MYKAGLDQTESARCLTKFGKKATFVRGVATTFESQLDSARGHLNPEGFHQIIGFFGH